MDRTPGCQQGERYECVWVRLTRDGGMTSILYLPPAGNRHSCAHRMEPNDLT